jgi:hypothetical protein
MKRVMRRSHITARFVHHQVHESPIPKEHAVMPDFIPVLIDVIVAFQNRPFSHLYPAGSNDLPGIAPADAQGV